VDVGLLTTTAGWFPRPAELRDARRRHAEGDLDDAALARVTDDATRAIVKAQERLGLDVLVDGQLGRADMISDFMAGLDGCEILGYVRCFDNRYYRLPRIAGALARREARTVAAWRVAAAAATKRPVKAVLAGPFTLMAWSSNEHYRSRETCCLALAEIVRAEAEDLLAAGATEIQIDEPAIGARVEELDLAAAALEHVAAALRPRARVWLHLAYGDPASALERIFRLPVDGVALELANSGGEAFDALDGLPGDKLLGAGVIDVLDPQVESADVLRARVARLLERVPAERLWLLPDAGLRTLAPAVAEAKLAALVAAARL
jgi:5-methyltetrahydropteroyltriglutamate--homocysteine methyltransferase